MRTNRSIIRVAAIAAVGLVSVCTVPAFAGEAQDRLASVTSDLRTTQNIADNASRERNTAALEANRINSEIQELQRARASATSTAARTSYDRAISGRQRDQADAIGAYKAADSRLSEANQNLSTLKSEYARTYFAAEAEKRVENDPGRKAAQELEAQKAAQRQAAAEAERRRNEEELRRYNEEKARRERYYNNTGHGIYRH
jgi:hypothetical protein